MSSDGMSVFDFNAPLREQYSYSGVWKYSGAIYSLEVLYDAPYDRKHGSSKVVRVNITKTKITLSEYLKKLFINV